MFSQITPRMLVGGWIDRRINVNVLAFSGVSHIVNFSSEKLTELEKNQFWVLELDEGLLDLPHDISYWEPVFNFAHKAMYGTKDAVIYFHSCPEERFRSPIACYAAMRALGYSMIQARRKLEVVHPILSWCERAARGVDDSFREWCRLRGRNPVLREKECERIHEDLGAIRLLAANSPLVQTVLDEPTFDDLL